MNNEEKDIYIKTKIKDKNIPEKIDELFNNSINLVESRGENTEETNNKINNISEELNKNEGKKKFKGVTLKKVIVTAACATIVFAGSNIYASTQGYQNIFFMIKDMISSSKDTNNRDEILSDKDITISYKPIEITKGIRIQVNRLVIKDNQAALYLQVERTDEEEQAKALIFRVNDESGNKLGEISQYSTNPIYTTKIVLENYKNDTKVLELKVKKVDEPELVTLKIDLENREISVVGNQEAVKKISEEELKKYLGAFALLDYTDARYEGLSGERLENNKKIDVAKQIAKINNIEISTKEKKYKEYQEILDADKLNKIIGAFTEIELEKDGLMKLDNSYGYYKSTVNGKKQYMPPTASGYELPTGLCLDVKDISYISGIYNVTFTYCYPTQTDYDEGKVEELPVFEMSVGLILNENNQYSKYFISSKTESRIISEKEGTDTEDSKTNEFNEIEINTNSNSNSNANINKSTNSNTNVSNTTTITNTDSSLQKFLGTWKLDYATSQQGEKNYDISLPNLYGIEKVEISLTFKENGMFAQEIKNNISGVTEGLLGKYEIIDDNTIKRTFLNGTVIYTYYTNNEYGEMGISNISIKNGNAEEFYVKEIDETKRGLVGSWWRTFNGTTEENQKNQLTFLGDGTFVEKEAAYKDANGITQLEIVREGKYKITQENNWDVVILTYSNGEVHKMLYGRQGENKKGQDLNYNDGKQVYKQCSTYDAVG